MKNQRPKYRALKRNSFSAIKTRRVKRLTKQQTEHHGAMKAPQQLQLIDIMKPFPDPINKTALAYFCPAVGSPPHILDTFDQQLIHNLFVALRAGPPEPIQ